MSEIAEKAALAAAEDRARDEADSVFGGSDGTDDGREGHASEGENSDTLFSTASFAAGQHVQAATAKASQAPMNPTHPKFDFPDADFVIHVTTPSKNTIFRVHRAKLVERSTFFKALLDPPAGVAGAAVDQADSMYMAEASYACVWSMLLASIYDKMDLFRDEPEFDSIEMSVLVEVWEAARKYGLATLELMYAEKIKYALHIVLKMEQSVERCCDRARIERTTLNQIVIAQNGADRLNDRSVSMACLLTLQERRGPYEARRNAIRFIAKRETETGLVSACTIYTVARLIVLHQMDIRNERDRREMKAALAGLDKILAKLPEWKLAPLAKARELL